MFIGQGYEFMIFQHLNIAIKNYLRYKLPTFVFLPNLKILILSIKEKRNQNLSHNFLH